jgi:hypothetical protein
MLEVCPGRKAVIASGYAAPERKHCWGRGFNNASADQMFHYGGQFIGKWLIQGLMPENGS